MEPQRQPAASARPWWLLSLPASFLLHIAEEWWAGFAGWSAQVLATPLSTTRFVAVNSIAWPLSAVLTVVAISGPRLAWFPTAFATVLLVNAGLHSLGTLATGTYSPGLVTSLALYLPLAGLALRSGFRGLPARSFCAGLAVGLLIHAAVIVIALA